MFVFVFVFVLMFVCLQRLVGRVGRQVLCGILVLWYFGIVVFCVLCDIVVLWYCGILCIVWYCGIVVLCGIVCKRVVGELEDRYCVFVFVFVCFQRVVGRDGRQVLCADQTGIGKMDEQADL